MHLNKFEKKIHWGFLVQWLIEINSEFFVKFSTKFCIFVTQSICFPSKFKM